MQVYYAVMDVLLEISLNMRVHMKEEKRRKEVNNSGVLFGIFTSTTFLPLILYPGVKQSSKELKKELGSVYHHFFLLCPLLRESKA